jgi:beta-lactamase class A
VVVRTTARGSPISLSAPGQPAPPDRRRTSVGHAEGSLYRGVLAIKERHELEALGIAFYDAETTLQWSFNADELFHAASTMKLAVLLAVYRQVDRGEVTLDAPVHVRNKFLSITNDKLFMLEVDREGDPELYRNLGRTMAVRALAYEMITRSSNFATNLLVDVVGVPNIQQSLEEMGIEGVIVRRGVEDQAAFDAGINNEVTANGLLKLLRLIVDKKACSPAASADMLEILLHQRFKSGIPAGLPREARVAHKTGNISTVHHDAGIVFLEGRQPYVLVILTRFARENAGSPAVSEISRDIYEHLAGMEGER